MNKNIIALLLPVVLITGCFGGKESIKVELTAEDLAMYEGATAQSIFDDAEALVVKAREESFSFYVPGSLDVMEAELDKMRTVMLDANTEFRDVIAAKKSIELRFNQGIKTKSDVQTHLKPVIEQKDILDGMNAKEIDHDEYSDLTDELSDLIELVQEGKIEKARGEAPELLNDMLAFEVKVVKAVILNPVKALLEIAESRDADEHAPRALVVAENAYEKAYLFIEQNPRARDEIQLHGESALYMARRVNWITDSIIHYKSVEKSSWEAEVLAIELLFKPTMDAIDSDEIGDLALSEQAKKLAASIQPELDKLRLAEKSRDKALRELSQAQLELEAEIEERKLLDSQVSEVDAQKSELRNRVLALTRESERKSIKIRELNEALSLLQMPHEDESKDISPDVLDENNSEAAEPELITPEAVEPEVVTPEIVEPRVTAPEIAESKAAEPEVVDLEVVEPETAE